MGSASTVLILFAICFALSFVAACIANHVENAKLAKMSPAERSARQEARWQRVEALRLAMRNVEQGRVSPSMICPHCQTRGQVRTRRVTLSTGVSEGKVALAVLTGWISFWFTGLSSKQEATRAHCDHCGSTWHF